MTPKFIFTNSKGQSVEFTNDAPLFMKTYHGTGGSPVDIQTQKSPYQDGETLIDTVLEMRPITLEAVILGQSADEVTKYRRKLAQVLNPKLGQGKLRFESETGAHEIDVQPNGAPAFPGGEARGALYQECLIELLAPNPFWQDINATKTEIAIWRGAWEFPLELVEEGIELGYREPSTIVNVFNRGDVECGIRIQFKALATVENPSLFNVNTREQFKINKVMSAGEVLTVTTHFQNKRVELNQNGVISNAFNWIDLQSTFLQLDVGDNVLKYDADDGLDNLDVSIWHTPQYLGV